MLGGLEACWLAGLLAAGGRGRTRYGAVFHKLNENNSRGPSDAVAPSRIVGDDESPCAGRSLARVTLQTQTPPKPEWIRCRAGADLSAGGRLAFGARGRNYFALVALED